MKNKNTFTKPYEEVFKLSINRKLSDQYDFCQKIAPALGNFIFAFNMLNAVITKILESLIVKFKNNGPIEEIAHIIFENLSFSQKAQMLEKIFLCYVTNPEYLMSNTVDKSLLEKEVKNLFDEIENLNEIRNNYIHGDWSQNIEGSLVPVKNKVIQGIKITNLMEIDINKVEKESASVLNATISLQNLKIKIIP